MGSQMPFQQPPAWPRAPSLPPRSGDASWQFPSSAQPPLPPYPSSTPGHSSPATSSRHLQQFKQQPQPQQAQQMQVVQELQAVAQQQAAQHVEMLPHVQAELQMQPQTQLAPPEPVPSALAMPRLASEDGMQDDASQAPAQHFPPEPQPPGQGAGKTPSPQDLLVPQGAKSPQSSVSSRHEQAPSEPVPVQAPAQQQPQLAQAQPAPPQTLLHPPHMAQRQQQLQQLYCAQLSPGQATEVPASPRPSAFAFASPVPPQAAQYSAVPMDQHSPMPAAFAHQVPGQQVSPVPAPAWRAYSPTGQARATSPRRLRSGPQAPGSRAASPAPMGPGAQQPAMHVRPVSPATTMPLSPATTIRSPVMQEIRHHAAHLASPRMTVASPRPRASVAVPSVPAVAAPPQATGSLTVPPTEPLAGCVPSSQPVAVAPVPSHATLQSPSSGMLSPGRGSLAVAAPSDAAQLAAAIHAAAWQGVPVVSPRPAPDMAHSAMSFDRNESSRSQSPARRQRPSASFGSVRLAQQPGVQAPMRAASPQASFRSASMLVSPASFSPVSFGDPCHRKM